MKPRVKKTVRILVVIALIGAAGSGIYASGVLNSNVAVATSNIPTASPVVGPFERSVNSIGELRAARSSIVSAPFASRIVRLVPEGTRVEAGEPIIWLETADIEDSLRDAQADLALAERDLFAAEEQHRLQILRNEYDLLSEKARVELAEQREQDALQRFETESELVARGISPRTRQDELQLAFLQAGVDLRNARINLRRTEENLTSNLRVTQNAINRAELNVAAVQRRIDDLQERLNTAVLTAPVTGEVAYMRVWRNGALQRVAEGDSVFDRLNLVEIPDRSQMLAVVPVNELDNAQVRIGQPVRITLDALPGRTFTGVVERQSFATIDASQSQMRRAAPAPTSGSGPREFEIQIRVNENDPNFFQGMTATVAIVTGTLESALQIPLEALTLHEGQVGIFRRSIAGPDFVPVNVLMTNDRKAAIEAEGIDENTVVLLRNPLVSREEGRALSFQAIDRVNRAVLQRETPPATPQGERRPGGGGRPEGAPSGMGRPSA